MSPSTCSTSYNTNTRAPISLKFVIVGGGIAGLSAAYTLRKAGHSVVVLEKRSAKSMSFGGGVRAPPNMTRLLYRWGLGPMIKQKGRGFDKMIVINGNRGDMLGYIMVGEDFFQVLSSDMVVIQHYDLLNILCDVAVQEGVEIRRNANVIHADPKCVSVKLDTGEIISGDIIVAADGHSSSLRSNVMGLPEKNGSESSERILLVTFTVETSLLKDDEGFKLSMEPRNWTEWIAEDTNIRILNEGERFVGLLSRNYYGPSNEGDDEWSDERTFESYELDFTALEPRIQKLVRLSKMVASRVASKQPILEDFVNEDSSIVFVGEAAHPVAMFECSQGAALGIEDAETLGSLFSRIQSREQIRQFLMAYQEIRQSRCARTYQLQKTLDMMKKRPIGPQQDARDVLIRHTLTYSDWNQMDDATFRSMWGDQMSLFCFDAEEAVDDWWNQWGSYISPSENPQSKSVFNGLEVWISSDSE